MSRFDWWQSRTIEAIQEEAAARPLETISMPEAEEHVGFADAAHNELIYGHPTPPKDIIMSPEMYRRYQALFASQNTTKTLSPKAKKRAKRKAQKKVRLAERNKQRQGFSLGRQATVLPYAKADAEITSRLSAKFVGSLDTLVVADPILKPDTAYLIGNGRSEEIVHVTNIGTKKNEQ